MALACCPGVAAADPTIDEIATAASTVMSTRAGTDNAARNAAFIAPPLHSQLLKRSGPAGLSPSFDQLAASARRHEATVGWRPRERAWSTAACCGKLLDPLVPYDMSWKPPTRRSRVDRAGLHGWLEGDPSARLPRRD